MLIPFNIKLVVAFGDFMDFHTSMLNNLQSLGPSQVTTNEITICHRAIKVSYHENSVLDGILFKCMLLQ